MKYHPGIIGVIMLPFIITAFLLTLYNSTTHPVWADEIVYWHEIASVRAVGLNSGYYTFEELPAPAAYTHFDTHGPVFPLLMAAITAPFPWHYTSMVWFNLAFMVLALSVFAALTRGRNPAAIAAVIATAWVLLLFLPYSMQEALHGAVAIAAAAVFYVQLNGRLDRRARLAAALFFWIMSLIRLTWLVLLLPLLLLDARTTRQLLSGVILVGVASMLSLLLYSAWSAPYPYGFLAALTSADSPLLAIRLLVENASVNIRRVRVGDPIELLVRYQVVVMLIALLIAALIRRGRLRQLRAWLPLSQTEIAFHLLNLGVLVCMQVIIYDVWDWRDTRVMAPHLLTSLLVLVLFNRYRLAGLLIVMNLILLPSFVSSYGIFAANAKESFGIGEVPRNQMADHITAFADSLSGLVVYDPNAASAWCNTLLASGLYPEMVGVPAGIGISVGWVFRPEKPPRSRYLLLSDPQAAFVEQAALVVLAETSRGTLYLNPNCGTRAE